MPDQYEKLRSAAIAAASAYAQAVENMVTKNSPPADITYCVGAKQRTAIMLNFAALHKLTGRA